MINAEEKLQLLIAESINSMPGSGNNFKDCFTLAKVILDAGYTEQVSEPIKVEIKKDSWNCYQAVVCGTYTHSLKETLHKCKQKGLKVVE